MQQSKSYLNQVDQIRQSMLIQRLQQTMLKL